MRSKMSDGAGLGMPNGIQSAAPPSASWISVPEATSRLTGHRPAISSNRARCSEESEPSSASVQRMTTRLPSDSLGSSVARTATRVSAQPLREAYICTVMLLHPATAASNSSLGESPDPAPPWLAGASDTSSFEPARTMVRGAFPDVVTSTVCVPNAMDNSFLVAACIGRRTTAEAIRVSYSLSEDTMVRTHPTASMAASDALRWAEVSSEAPAITLLYDGACSLCRREAAMLRRIDRGRGRIGLIDIADEAFDAARYGLTFEQVMGAMHGILPDGRPVVGPEAFRRAYAAVGRGWIVAWTRWPILRPMVDAAYRWFARNRLRLTGRSCENDRCRV